ncbi:hypothetical protein CcaCcLH18_01814 [Colletotrichum camelliae]|nr:hypothetical protein CcaCcLH18_01814 [Colletotrichum camelliae]
MRANAVEVPIERARRSGRIGVYGDICEALVELINDGFHSNGPALWVFAGSDVEWLEIAVPVELIKSHSSLRLCLSGGPYPNRCVVTVYAQPNVNLWGVPGALPGSPIPRWIWSLACECLTLDGSSALEMTRAGTRDLRYIQLPDQAQSGGTYCPTCRSGSTSDAVARTANLQQMQAQASARLEMFLSDGTPNPLYNRRAVSGNDKKHRGAKVAAVIGNVDQAFAGSCGTMAGGAARSQPVHSDTILRDVGAQFSK